jgi:hypothetical protein
MGTGKGRLPAAVMSKIKVAPLSEILVEAMASGGSVTVWNKSIWICAVDCDGGYDFRREIF